MPYLTVSDSEKKKIAAVEELLENILLFLSGVGLTGSLTYILQRMTSFIRLISLLKDKTESFAIKLKISD